MVHSKISQKKRSPSSSARHDFPVVAIGASAGGLEAYTQLLKTLPAKTGMAFVLIQHLDPNHESMLAPLLSTATKMPVLQVKQGMRIERNHVYVIPPNTSMILEDGSLKLYSRSRSRSPYMPVDIFMRSLAEVKKDRAIGVVLSGTASDGTLGLQAIKAANGLTFAQDQASAKYDGMPQSAVLAGCVDSVLPPVKIAEELTRIGGHPYLTRAPLLPSLDRDENSNGAESEIFALLRREKGIDFSTYKPSTIHRRIARRMALRKIDNPDEYVKVLQENPGEVQALYDDCLINVTNFFRDPEVFRVLSKKVFPQILANRDDEEPIRIWVPGCSTGEEVYSLAICLFEFLQTHPSSRGFQIFGTDVSERSLEVARAGVYIENIAMDISPERLRQFFLKSDRHFQITKAIRDCCVFSRHDVSKDPPFSRMDLISCRNLLIYLGPELHKKILPLFHYGLKATGYLLLGSSESVGSHSDLFGVVDKKNNIFSRKPASARPDLNLFSTRYLSDKALPSTPDKDLRQEPEADLYKDADRLLLSRLNSASVLLDKDLEILKVWGPAQPYLEVPSGKSTHNILKMAQEELALHLRVAVQKVKKTGQRVKVEGIRIKIDGEVKAVRLEVLPFRSRLLREPHYLVIFEGGPQGSVKGQKKFRRSVLKFSEKRSTHLLKEEMRSLKDELRESIEDLEVSNEKLKVANEEILSSNEELQSTNEELETAKEELQSANEEMSTVNEELQNRNLLLSQLNNDLTNFLNSVQLPLVMVGNDLRVRRFTPLAGRMFNLIASDVGRSILDIKPRFDIPDLEELITTSIDTVTTHEQEVQDTEGRWHSILIRPYKTSENKIEGAVIVLFDISSRKKQEAEILGLNEQLWRRAADLERTNAELEQFAYAASHDLQEPLRQITNFTDLLAREMPDGNPEAKKFIRHIVQGTTQMQHLITDLLSYSQTLKAPDIRSTDLDQILGQVMANLDAAVQRHKGIVTWDALPTVQADPTLMVQLFQNLIGNALKYHRTDHPPRIHVKTENNADELVISVSDDGMGIPPQYRDRIFTIYQRLHTGKEIPGTGIGLAICKKIVERHKGRIWVESEVEKGSTFFFTLRDEKKPS